MAFWQVEINWTICFRFLFLKKIPTNQVVEIYGGRFLFFFKIKFKRMQVQPVGLVLREPAKLIGLDELENRKQFFLS